MLIRLIAVGSLIVGLVGCSQSVGSDSSEDSDSTDSAITNAMETSAFPAVGQLSINGNYWCTATLIAPQLLLTAAHCVYYRQANIHIRYGKRWYTADAWRWNEGYDSDPQNRAVGLADDFDIAVVHLTTPVSGVTPMPIANDSAVTGQPFTIVGYGESYSGEGIYRTKREATATVSSVQPTWFFGTGASSPCHADSGGPAIDDTGVVIGVFARMYNDCRGGTDGFSYMNVGGVRSWIDAQFAAR